MHVGIVTFQRSFSYGAALQCWALTTFLRKLGHKVSVVDYCPSHRKDRANPISSRRFYTPGNIVAVPLYFRFSKFIGRKIPLTPKRYPSIAALRGAELPFDAVVCGSDQIWNADHTGNKLDAGYFASFGFPEMKRISYAASLGGDRLRLPFLDDFRRYTSKMDAISAREKRACAFIETLTGRPCEHVLDPTLLALSFSPIEEAISTPDNYILSFCLQRTSHYNGILRKVREQLRLPIVQVRTAYRMNFPDAQNVLPSPGQWLTLVRKAAFVVTNSFHGICFALNYRRPFLAAQLIGDSAYRNERLISLLQRFDLSDYFWGDSVGGKLANIVQRKIDWKGVHQILARNRDDSAEFLRMNLTGSTPIARSLQTKPQQKRPGKSERSPKWQTTD